MVIAALLLFVLLNAYAGASGLKDAILYSMRAYDAFAFNEHILFVAERAVVLLAVFAATFTSPGAACIVALAFAQTFTFCHNQVYLLGRHRIDPAHQPYDFWYQSSTSSAKIEIGAKGRFVLLLTGLATLVLLFLL